MASAPVPCIVGGMNGYLNNQNPKGERGAKTKINFLEHQFVKIVGTQSIVRVIWCFVIFMISKMVNKSWSNIK